MFVESGPGIRSSLRDLPTHLTLLTVSHGFMGWVFSITGPVTAIISPPSAGPFEGRYAAGIVTGTLWLISAVLAPVVVLGREILPVILINLLAGLALFPVLGNALVEASKGRHRFGSLACFMLTVSQITIWNVGAPFWGLVTGLLVSMILEPKDFQK